MYLKITKGSYKKKSQKGIIIKDEGSTKLSLLHIFNLF